VQRIAVEEILEEAVEEIDGDENDRALPPGGVKLRFPDGMRRQELQAQAEAGKGEKNGEREERKGKFLLDGVGCAGMGSDSTNNLP
jgi:hypothetical protein